MNKRQKRAKLITDARTILDKAEAEQRGLTEAEEAQYNGLLAEADKLLKEIEREERQAQLEAGLNQPVNQPLRPVPQDAANIGMNDGEVRRYSLLRAIRAAAIGDWREAGLEREASQAVAQRVGREPQGFFVPYDWQQRALTVGTPTAGGNTVQTTLMAENFIDLLRNRLALAAAGATTLTGLIGNVSIPRQSGGATAYWVAENAAPTASQQTFDQVALTPKTVGAFTDISRRLLNQSSIDVENLVRTDLATILALAIDLAGLHGSGASNQPTGLQNISGIGSVVGGTNGAAPIWDHVVGLETAVAVANADLGRLAYVMNAKGRGKLKRTPISSPYPPMLWDTSAGNTPVNGYRSVVSNQVASNLTKGTSVGICSAIFFGNWADLLIGLWGALDLMVDPYSGSTAGTIRVVALQDCDVNVRHPESFAAMLDMLTT
ncbi:MAG: phage major capsid protein [Caldilineaceae bacterium]